jgi:hypothetical protein
MMFAPRFLCASAVFHSRYLRIPIQFPKAESAQPTRQKCANSRFAQEAEASALSNDPR